VRLGFRIEDNSWLGSKHYVGVVISLNYVGINHDDIIHYYSNWKHTVLLYPAMRSNVYARTPSNELITKATALASTRLLAYSSFPPHQYDLDFNLLGWRYTDPRSKKGYLSESNQYCRRYRTRRHGVMDIYGYRNPNERYPLQCPFYRDPAQSGFTY